VLAPVRLLAIALLCLSCGTDAHGIETCRSIERARCEAAEACGLVEDIAGCQRFARDHCLHGLVTDDPGPNQVNACVGTLETLARCAKRNGRRSSPGECNADWINVTESVCELVIEPELAPRCSFLSPPDPEPEPESKDPDDAGND
jgi:hypothetical protein